MIAQLNLVSSYQEGSDSSGNGNGHGKAQSNMFSACVHVTGYNQNSSERGSQRGGGGGGAVLDMDSCIESPLRTGIDSEEEREREGGREREKKREREREREEDRRNNKADRNKSTPSPPTIRHPINNNESHPQHLYPVKKGRPNVEGSIARLAAHGHRALVFVCGPASMVQHAAALSMKYGTDFRHETFEL